MNLYYQQECTQKYAVIMSFIFFTIVYSIWQSDGSLQALLISSHFRLCMLYSQGCIQEWTETPSGPLEDSVLVVFWAHSSDKFGLNGAWMGAPLRWWDQENTDNRNSHLQAPLMPSYFMGLADLTDLHSDGWLTQLKFVLAAQNIDG